MKKLIHLLRNYSIKIKNDKKITSSIFELQVDKSINSENSIVSTNEFNALLNGLASLSEYDNYKEKVLNARDIDSEITGTSTSHPVRVLRNKLTREYIKLEKSNADSSEIEALGKGALRKAVIDGDVENGSVMAGQIAGLVKEKQSCKEIINELVYEFEETLRRI